MFISLKTSDCKWKDCTLLLPCVAVGNVGQLALDLIVFNLNAKLCGYMHSPSLLPVTGSNAYVKNSRLLATSCEVYESANEKLVILQFRAPVSTSKRRSFVAELIDWIRQNEFVRVILLTSCFSQFCSGQDLNSNVFRYLKSPSFKDPLGLSRLEEELHVRALELRVPYTHEESPTGSILLPGSGVTKLIYNACVENEIPAIALIKFCSEGDNTPDALALANLLAMWLHLKEISDKPRIQRWAIPPSWSLPFGNLPPATIY